MSIFIFLFILVLLVEATTQLAVKASVFYKIRKFIESKSEFFGELVTCGYCFSVWASLFWNLVFLVTSNYIYLVESKLLSFLIFVILTHRLSNYLHGVSDRFFDTSKDIRFNHINN